MRGLTYWMNMSVDGFIADTQGNLGFETIDEEIHRRFNQLSEDASMFLYGRRMWELMDGHWPTADQDPDAHPVEVEYAQIWKAKPKLVFSRTLTLDRDDVTVVADAVEDAVRELKQGDGGDLVLGGAETATVFARAGLIDRLRLFVAPMAMGEGRSLFGALEQPLRLSLSERREPGSGAVELLYDVREPKP